MKRSVSGALALAVLAVSGMVGCRSTHPGVACDIVVAVDGDDRNPGTVDRPVRSWTRAQELARQIWSTSPVRSEVRVLFRSGIWQLDAPVVFTPADSPPATGRTVFAAWPGERPVFSAGIRVQGFEVDGEGIWRLQLPEGHRTAEHLFVNGQRAVRARHPSTGAFLLRDVTEHPPSTNRSRQGYTEVRLKFDPQELQPLIQLSPQELQRVDVVVHHKWDHTRRRIVAVDGVSGVVVVTGQAMKPWNPMSRGCLAYFENVPTALDAPGEWSVRADGRLEYRPRPGERPESSEVWLAATPQLLVFEGQPTAKVARIRLEGLTFLYPDYRTPPGGFEPQQAAASIEAAVMADWIEHVELVNLELAHTGAHGIWFRRGCTHSRIEHCHLHDLGGGAVKIGDTAPPRSDAELTHSIVVDNNIFHHGGRHFPCACGVWIGHSASNRVSQNDIGDFYYTGISVGWVWGYGRSVAKANEIAFNHVHHLGMGWLSDMGGIYTLGRSEGTRVHGNWFHHIWAHTYGGWGLYTDEGSTGIVLENNVVHDTKDGSFHQHYGRGNIVRNNILAFSRDAQIRVSRWDDRIPPPTNSGVPEVRVVLERNIVVWDTGQVWHGPWSKLSVEARSNLYWQVGGTPTNFAGHPLSEWQRRGLEVGSRIADPKFADLKNRRFELAPDSPAWELGFRPWPLDRAGVYGDPDWIRRAREAPMPDFSKLPDWSK
jgi:hypothetical protein